MLFRQSTNTVWVKMFRTCGAGLFLHYLLLNALAFSSRQHYVSPAFSGTSNFSLIQNGTLLFFKRNLAQYSVLLSLARVTPLPLPTFFAGKARTTAIHAHYQATDENNGLTGVSLVETKGSRDPFEGILDRDFLLNASPALQLAFKKCMHSSYSECYSHTL